MCTHSGIIVNGNAGLEEVEIRVSNRQEDDMPFGNSGTWCFFKSDEEISRLVDYLSKNDPGKKELKNSILHWQKSILRGSQQIKRNLVGTGTQVVSSADTENSFSANDLLTKATTLLEAKYGLPSRKNMGPKWRWCECLEPILPCRYHCLKCHETFFTNIELEHHKNSSCVLSLSSVKKRKIEIGARNFSIPGSSLKPLVGKGGHILRQLKINLLDMEAALPDGARRGSKARFEWRSAWSGFVKSADTVYERMRTQHAHYMFL